MSANAPPTPRSTGRPRTSAGSLVVYLPGNALSYVLDRAEHEDRPVSRVARQLIVEAIAARQRAQKRGRSG